MSNMSPFRLKVSGLETFKHLLNLLWIMPFNDDIVNLKSAKSTILMYEKGG